MEFAGGADGDVAVVEREVEGMAAVAAVLGEEVQVVAGDGDALLVGGGAESGEGAGDVFEFGDGSFAVASVSGG